MEHNSELVEIGKLIDENSFKRQNKNIIIDNAIEVDFIDRKNIILHEVKKSKSIEEASIWQLKYYIYYLENRGLNVNKGQISYPLLKKNQDIILTDEDRKILKNVISDIEKISQSEKPLDKMNNKVCKKCAYYDLCFS
jgi:CRISPR-associated exonuclease Cas4